MEAAAEQRSWVGAGGFACRAQAACWRSLEEVAGAQHGEKVALALSPGITALPGRLPCKARTSFQICKTCMWLHDEIFHKHSNLI